MNLTAAQIRKFFEARLQGQRLSNRAQVVVRCPFHDDHDPSLSVNLEKGLWKCHGPCGSGGLLDFEEKFSKCDRETARENIAELLGEKQLFLAQPKPEAAYPYVDAHGKLVAEKLRFRRDDGSKYFRWRRPDGKGGWEYRLDGFRPPLYRLQELIGSNHLLVVEGEKCADAVAEALKNQPKLSVTTSPDGAAKPGQAPKWSPDYSEYFKGKIVAILPDNDEPGRAHAEAVASSIRAYAAGVKVVPLPGLKEHQDAYDYLQSHTAEELLAAIKQASQWRPRSTHAEFFVGAMRFANTVPDEIEWAVKPIIPRGWNGFVIADPKSLKSYSVLDLLISLSLGLDWLGFEVPHRVHTAILAREDYWGLTAWRIKHFLRGKQADPQLLESLNVLTSLGPEVTAGLHGPTSVTVDPSGRFAYVANALTDDVSAFAINPTTGVLTSLGPSVTAGNSPASVTVDPTGRFAYVVNLGGDVSAFAINPTTGVLTSLAPSVTAGNGPVSVTVDPSGRFAYVANFGGDVSAFAINPTTGVLTSLGTDVPTGGSGPAGIITTGTIK